ADAAENAPHARPIHARRVSSGEVSSGSRPGTAAAGLAAGVGVALAAAPPADATVVVLPAKSGTAAACGLGAAGFATVGGALGTCGLLSSAINHSDLKLRILDCGLRINSIRNPQSAIRNHKCFII